MVDVVILGLVNVDVPTPPVNAEPPVAAEYQSTVAPDGILIALKVTVPVPQRLALEPVGTVIFSTVIEPPVLLAVPQPALLKTARYVRELFREE